MCVDVYVHVRVYVYAYVRMYVRVRVYACVSACAYACMNMHTRTPCRMFEVDAHTNDTLSWTEGGFQGAGRLGLGGQWVRVRFMVRARFTGAR